MVLPAVQDESRHHELRPVPQLALLLPPVIHDIGHIQIVRAGAPAFGKRHVGTGRRWIGYIDLKAGGQGSGISHRQHFAAAQGGQCLCHVRLALRHQSAYIGLVVRVGDAQTEIVGALRQYGFGQLGGTLADDA